MKPRVQRYNMRVGLIFLTFFIAICFLTSAFAEGLMRKEAVEYFKEAIEEQKQGNIDYAISLYSKAIYANPDYVNAHNNLGTAYAQKGDLKRAEKEYSRAVNIDPHYATALLNLAILRAERKDYKGFYEYWKRAKGLNIYSPFLIDEED